VLPPNGPAARQNSPGLVFEGESAQYWRQATDGASFSSGPAPVRVFAVRGSFSQNFAHSSTDAYCAFAPVQLAVTNSQYLSHLGCGARAASSGEPLSTGSTGALSRLMFVPASLDVTFPSRLSLDPHATTAPAATAVVHEKHTAKAKKRDKRREPSESLNNPMIEA
jgi:hypothetical protein